MRNLKKIVLIGVVLVFLMCAFYHGLTIKEYEIESDKITSQVDILLITDLHSRIYGKNQSKLIGAIKEVNPDIIAFSGDILDDRYREDGVHILLEELKKIDIPKYYVTGNHEIYIGDTDYVKNLFSSNGVEVLDGGLVNLQIRDNKINICGVDDPYENRTTNDFLLDLGQYIEVEDEGYNILLSHRPEYVDFYKILDVDLILSGHAHGGQVRIPFLLNGLLAPNQGFFPKYAGGKYDLGNNYLVVSRGLFRDFRLPRVFNPPEIVKIRLRPSS